MNRLIDIFEVISSGWFLVNILAPMVLPIVGLMIMKGMPIEHKSPDILRIMNAVKDGQLCWAGVAIGAVSIYEVWTSWELGKHLPSGYGWAFGGLVSAMLPTLIYASGEMVWNTKLLNQSHNIGIKCFITHYKMFTGSVILSLIIAYCATRLHLALM